jgi:non-specific serine/threonine protein kinase
VRRRHAEYLVALVEESDAGMDAGRQREWVQRLDADYENLRAAVAWMQEAGDHRLRLRLTGAIWQYGWVHGRWAEIHRWVDRALADDPRDEPRLRVWALRTAAELACYEGDLVRGEALGGELLALADAEGDVRARAHALAVLALAAGDDTGRAYELNRESADACRRVGDAHQLGWSLNNLGDLAMRLGRFEEAAEHLSAAASLADGEGLDDVAAIALGNLSTIALARGDLREARDLARRSLSAATQLHYPEQVMYSLEQHAALDALEARPERAARILGAAEMLRIDLGRPLQPVEQEVHERTVASLREQLGAERLEEAWRAGAAMAADEAVAAVDD